MSVEVVQVGDDAVILDKLGTKAIVTHPAAQDAVLVDLGGTMNGTTDRYARMFMLAPGQAAELCAEIILSGARFSTIEHFMADVAGHVKRLLTEGEAG
jgi:hypothetical protein